MKKRQLILNEYKTAEDGLFTLASCKITKASQVQSFVSVPGRFAPLDFSTVLTDGQPYYGNASLTAVLESSEGTRAERQARIDYMKNLLDGYTAKIVHPDYPGNYMIGRVQVVPDFNGLSYCSVSVSAVLEPWLYNEAETVVKATLPNEVEGKNLLDLTSIYGTTTTANGATLSCDFDGGITGSGTPTGYVYIFNKGYTLPVDTYTLSFSGNGRYIGSTYSIRDKDRNVLATYTVHFLDPKKTFNLADYPNYYDIVIEIKRSANNVELSGTAYFQLERGSTATAYEVYHPAGERALTLTNEGRLAVVPTIMVTGSVAISYKQITTSLSAGAYQIPDIYLTPGKHFLICSGDGTVTFTYREAVLAG